MKVVKTIQDLREVLQPIRLEGKSIGLIPTMGALHVGHLSLVKMALKENDYTIATIFVNPIQFNNSNDLEKYPRTIDSDIQLLELEGVDLLFCPDEKEMYPITPLTKIQFGKIEEKLEGAHRPGHFSGVGVVVSKFFSIIQPTHAYFGQKDLQQYLIIKQLVQDLSFQIKLHCCPTLREPDGLAMSSRNIRLSKEKRPVASKIYENLQMASKLVKKEGIAKTKSQIESNINSIPDLKLEYFEIVNGETLDTIEDESNYPKLALCIAVYLDDVRLIDNIIVE